MYQDEQHFLSVRDKKSNTKFLWVLELASTKKIIIKTNADRFHDITDQVREALYAECKKGESGVLTLFCCHTSCALTINEAYDQSAREDLENFLRYTAPKNLGFIKHTLEGPDDSVSHMKTMLLETSLNLIVEDREIILGQWQGIYLAEFRESGPKSREILYKFIRE